MFGLKENTVSSTFDSIIPSVGSKYDIGISSFTVTKERIRSRHFVTYFKAGSTFVVQKGNPNKVDSSNLCGVKVAVQTVPPRKRKSTRITSSARRTVRMPSTSSPPSCRPM